MLMPSPARRHRERVAARIAHAAARDRLAPIENAKPYALMLAKLDADMRRLKQIQSVAKKIDLKRQILPEYDAWVDGALETNSGEQDDILTNIMVWRLDTEDFPGALRIAEYVLKNDIKLPARYNRNAACLVAEEIADAAKRALDEGRLVNGFEITMDNALGAASILTAGMDMPDEVRAKLHKSSGLVHEVIGRHTTALGHLKTALEFNSNAGVKKDIERMTRIIKNTPASADTAGAG
ncbi:MAG: phage terminase small subunit [Proteobacteria bacterium]|nr:phage terminase small subunit [Pseudomonadota bacterium]